VARLFRRSRSRPRAKPPRCSGRGQAPAEHLGTASGLLRTFGYVGSIASSAITGIVFHSRVTDHGVHLIAWILIGVSLALVVMTIADRALPARSA